MSRYVALRVRGIIKPEFRGDFEPIAMHGKWDESPDPLLRDFAESYFPYASRIPCSAIPTGIEWRDKGPWPRTYDPITGEWTFECEVNIHSFPLWEWETTIAPHCFESISHYECRIEAAGDEKPSPGTVMLSYRDGKFYPEDSN